MSAASMDPTASTPWWKRAVFYQIYPRSFLDSDGDGVGDLAGVRARLAYLADLGVDAIWLSPFFASPMKDFGYDVSDYRAVDPALGGLADFDAVVEEAHRLGLKVVIDQVWSHTSDQHPWFKESDASAASDKGDWYVWADARPDGSPPNNWQASFGGPSWTWSPRRRQYYLHNFLPSQPDLNFRNPAVQEAVLDVARFWLDRGVDGFRLDVVNYFFHDAALRDNPPAALPRTPALTYALQRHVHNRSQPETLAFLSRLRALLDSYGERMAVGEIVDHDPLETQAAYTRGRERLHSAYSFYLLDARRADPGLFREAIEGWRGRDGWPSWSLGNHDVPRFPSRLAPGGEPDPRLTRCLLAILMTLPGTPYIYQGDELGLPQAQVPFERLRDPFAIAAYTGGAGRDGARTPMPWSAQEANAGFSAAVETWLPLDPAHRELAVDRQQGHEESTLEFVRRLLAVRRRLPALQLGGGAPLALEAPETVLAFVRELGDQRCALVFELGGEAARIARPPAGALIDIGLGGRLEDGALVLPPYGGALVALDA
ncbi:MAG: alpha-amylase family glycosyl hydrolase [Phenylobacterium sp.]|uniref:alpha-amylase family glycosyl hydrolase n=1 Tax=Phenylobacterium sp. TaxID=1871053 RepID=UPI00391C843F